MIITDKEAKKQLRYINHSDLKEMISGYPENEINGRSDLEIILNEATYLLEMYEEDTMFYYDLQEARDIMRETKNGTLFKDTSINLEVRERQMIIYKDIIQKLSNAGYNTTRIRKEAILSQSTLQNIREGKSITMDTLDLLCSLTGCRVEELIEYKKD